jgi:hypothetical protein
MKSLSTAVMGAACALILGASAASAEIVCNREGDCWHVKDHGWIRPEHGLIVYPDSWKWAEHEKYRWREHEGRGYWHEGRWVELR